MDVAYYFIDILKYVIAGISIFFTCYYWIRTELHKGHELEILEYKKNYQTHIFPLKLQAYERLVLFVERINPTQSILRAHQFGMTAKQLQHTLVEDLTNEFYHNITQQLYVDTSTWAIVKRLKDDTVSMINTAFHTLSPDASSVEMGKLLLTHLSNLDSNPYDRAIEALKRDIQKFL